MRIIPLSAALLLWAVTLNAQTAKHASATQPAWGPAPAVFPAGAQMAVISGDPSKAAPFVVELKVPDGYQIPPHFHPTDETVTVKEGTFNVGMGLWLFQLPVLAMGAIILGLIYLGTAIIYWVVTALAKRDRLRVAFKAISPGMFLRLPRTPPLDETLPLSAEWRPGEVW